MASVITATVSSGLTQSADNSGVLQLASGAGNLVTVPSVTGTAMVSGNMPAFSAYRSTSQQSVTSSTWTKVQLQAEVFDTANAYDSTTNYRFTPQVAGYYQITGSLYFTSTATTRAISALYKNGSEYIIGNYLPSFNNTQGVALVNALIYLNGSTDYVELWGFIQGTSPTFVDSTACSMCGYLARTA
jgi:hypothetical protein